MMLESHESVFENQYQQIIESIIQLGQASFKCDLKIQTIRNYLKNMLQQKSWKARLNKNLLALLREMIQSKVQGLSLQSPFNYTIENPIQQLKHINFDELKILEINRLKMTNIQDLCLLKMPKLQILNMSFNNVSRLKALNKVQFPHLKMLAVDHNPIVYMGSMTWSNSNLSELQINKIKIFEYRSNHVIDQDMSSLLKLKSKDQMKFCIRSSFRIKLQKIKDMMKKRYQSIQLDQ